MFIQQHNNRTIITIQIVIINNYYCYFLLFYHVCYFILISKFGFSFESMHSILNIQFSVQQLIIEQQSFCSTVIYRMNWEVVDF